MKQLLAFALTLSTIISLAAQQAPTAEGPNDTIYINNEGGFLMEVKDRHDASGYTLRGEFRTDKYTREVFYLDTPKLMASYQCEDQVYVTEDSSYRSVTTLKKKLYEEYYRNGQIKISCNYYIDQLDGNFKVFYPSGKLKRHDVWDFGNWVEGKCFDESGAELPYYMYQDNAEFVGGRAALKAFLSKNVIYPELARESEIIGTVFVGFIVEKDGTLSDIHILKGKGTLLDKEALRVVKAMPKWKAAKFEGKLIKVSYRLPIAFW